MAMLGKYGTLRDPKSNDLIYVIMNKQRKDLQRS